MLVHREAPHQEPVHNCAEVGAAAKDITPGITRKGQDRRSRPESHSPERVTVLSAPDLPDMANTRIELGREAASAWTNC